MPHDDLFYEIEAEAAKAAERYGPFTSTHEALGVLTEEYHELLDAVRNNSLASVEMEAVQVAAVCLRLARQCRNEIPQSGVFGERSTK